jgi:hypothetical protein
MPERGLRGDHPGRQRATLTASGAKTDFAGPTFYAFSAVIACLACLLQAIPARTKLAKSARSPQRRPASNLPWLSLAGLK